MLNPVRAWGLLMVSTLAAFPAMMACNAPALAAHAAISAVPASSHHRGSLRSHRRARRAPPGGVYARSAIVLDPATGKILYEKNADQSVPIASISKLMTAMVFLEQKPALDRQV